MCTEPGEARHKQVKLFTQNKLRNMARIITFGEIMLRLATPGHLRFSQTHEFEATFGGGEANVAVSGQLWK